jgi:hypothetical protein
MDFQEEKKDPQIQEEKYLYRCEKYSPQFIMSFMSYSTTSIPGWTQIPKTVVSISTSESVISDIRKIFNIVTSNNVDSIKDGLRELITGHLVRTVPDEVEKEMNNISLEILNSFIVYESNINIYLQMLNNIYTITINNINENTGVPVQLGPIGKFFLENCRLLMNKHMSEEYVKNIITMDQENEDELDLMNKEKNKIFNLITTICALFSKRAIKSHIKISVEVIYRIVSFLIQKYIEINDKMNKLGNLYAGEPCSDEFEFECLYNMRAFYTEQILAFIKTEYQAFMNDPTAVTGKRQVDGKLIIFEEKLSDLVQRFKTIILPNISESHIKMKCKEIFI